MMEEELSSLKKRLREIWGSLSGKHRRFSEDRRADKLNECQRTEIWHSVGTWKILLNKITRRQNTRKNFLTGSATSKGRELLVTGGLPGRISMLHNRESDEWETIDLLPPCSRKHTPIHVGSIVLPCSGIVRLYWAWIPLWPPDSFHTKNYETNKKKTMQHATYKKFHHPTHSGSHLLNPCFQTLNLCKF